MTTSLIIRLLRACLVLVAVLQINPGTLFPADDVAGERRSLAAPLLDSRAFVMVESAQHNESQQQEEDAFTADNLVVQEHVPCGYFKCFYPLQSNPSVGYLVTEIGRKRKTKAQKKLGFSWFEQSWQYAKHLENAYNISHFLLEAPIQVKLSEELATRLITNIVTKKRPRYNKGAKVGVQKVKIAKESHHLILATRRRKRKAFIRKFDDFFSSKVQDTETFATNFAQGMQETRLLLEKEPCLMNDFQVLLDATGNLHHLDFERCFPPLIDEERKRECFRECFHSLDKIERHVQKAFARIVVS